LSLAEFSYNNSRNSVTGVSPFFALHGFHPLADISLPVDPRVPAAESRVELLRTTLIQVQSSIKRAQIAYTRAANRKRSADPNFVIGNFVFLDSRNIRSSRPSKKLDFKWLGPFKITRVISPVAYQLLLPPTWRIHNVFHSSLLKPAPSSSFPNSSNPPPLPIVSAEGPEYEVKEILDSRLIRDQPHFLVDWVGYNSSERTWEPRSNLANATDALRDFHLRFPDKPF
jgi:hypothetical protein